MTAAAAIEAVIAATALAHDLWTQGDDYDVLAGPAPALRLRRG